MNAITWQQYMTFGGNKYDAGFAITNDGTYLYIVGITNQSGDPDVLLIKSDPSGNKLWNKTWGGPGVETVSAIALDNASNIYITGTTTSYGVGNISMFILKYTSGGAKAWNYTWGHTTMPFSTASGNDLLVQDSSYIYVVGTTNKPTQNDILVVKYDSSGNQIWNYTWGSGGADFGYAIGMDSNAKLYLVGSSTSYTFGGKDLIIVKMNSSTPHYLEYEHWGGVSDDFGNSLEIVDDELYIAGGTESFGVGGTDVAILKYDQSLEQQWAKTFGGSGNSNESATDMTYYNGSLLIAGTQENTEILLLQFLTNGDYESSNGWDTAGTDLAGGLTITPTGNIFVIGTTDGLIDPLSDIVLLKFSATYPEPSGGGIPAFGIEFLLIGLLLSVGFIILVRKNQKYLQAK
jgi:hypothetical protein